MSVEDQVNHKLKVLHYGSMAIPVLVKHHLMWSEPGRYFHWQGNCCRHVAVCLAALGERELPHLSWAVVEGIYSGSVMGNPNAMWDHATAVGTGGGYHVVADPLWVRGHVFAARSVIRAMEEGHAPAHHPPWAMEGITTIYSVIQPLAKMMCGDDPSVYGSTLEREDFVKDILEKFDFIHGRMVVKAGG